MEAQMHHLIRTHASCDQIFEITAKIARCTDAKFSIDLVCKAFGQSVAELHRGKPATLVTEQAITRLKDCLLVTSVEAYIAHNPIGKGTDATRADIESAIGHD